MRRRSIVVGLALVVVSILAAYLYYRESSSSTQKATIGSILILSGDFQSYGEQFRDGVALAEQVVEADGEGPEIDVLIFDSQGLKRRAIELVETLNERYHVSYIADIMGTGLALEAAPTFNERQMLVLSGVNTGPELTSKGGSYFFRLIPSDGVASVQLAEWATELGYKEAAVVHDTDEWAMGLMAELKRAFGNKGGRVISEVECPKGFELFGPLVSRVKAGSPEVVFLLLYPREAGLFLKEGARQGLGSAFMGTDNFTGQEVVEHAGDAAEGVLFVLPGEGPKETNEVYDRFRQEFRQKYGEEREPELFSITGYDVLMILADLQERFGTDTTAAAEFLSGATYRGASGEVQFDENGDLKVGQYRRMIFKNIDGRISPSSFPSHALE